MKPFSPASALLLCLLPAACSQNSGDSDLVSMSAALSINTSVNQIGRMTSSGNGGMRAFHQYDALGREAGLQNVLDKTSYVSTNTYGYPQSGVAVTGVGSVLTSRSFPQPLLNVASKAVSSQAERSDM